MKGPWVLLFFFVASGASGLGMSEDPQEKLSRTWDWEPIRSLEIRGEVQFEVISGPRPKVTVETTRALFDQLTVSNWFGAGTVAIESGLRGPREQGVVQVLVEVPSLAELTVLDRSSGRVSWPSSPGASLRVGENSTVTLGFSGTLLTVDASWLSSVKLEGKVEFLTATLRHQARLDAWNLAVGSAQLTLDENSTLEAGPGWTAAGTARHGSRITVPRKAGWENLVLREDSELRPRAGAD